MSTSKEFLLDNKSFVTKTDGETATVVRTGNGSALTQTEIEEAGDFYNSALGEIDYAEIYNLDFGANFINKKGASDEWMGKALSDKTYKDAFKKATDKNSSNVSWASIAEGNLNWQSSPNNKTANGRSTDSLGKFIGRYPLNKDRKQYDYLQVTAKEYKANEFSSGDGSGMIQDAEDRNMATIGSVFLPMQPGLAESTSVNWGGETMNAIEAAAANIAGSTIEGAGKSSREMLAGLVGSSKEGLQKIFDKAGGGVTGKEVAAYFAGQAVGKNVLTRTTGKIMNPNLELLFSGPALRTFSYNYKFTPREEKEAREVRNIIKFFKKQMSPKRKGKIFLESPNVFKLKYIFKSGGQHPFLNKIKLCALTSFNVQYTPDGSYMTYDDGSMTSYSASMTFQELNPIFEDEIEMSSNDMGF